MSDDTRIEEEELEGEARASEEEPEAAELPEEAEVSDEPETSDAGAATAELRLQRSGQETGDSFPINGRAVIGRFDPAMGPIDVDLASLPEAVYISRKHAVIEFAEGAWTITDLGSSNGSFVLVPGEDFQRIEEPTQLDDGAQLALGNARFTFHVVEDKDEGEEED